MSSYRETILVIEDNPDVADLLVHDILPELGYVARSAASAEEALESIPHCRPDLLVLDFSLPGMDGLALLRILAERKIEVPAILVTAHGSETVAVDAFRLGVCDYLTKPFQLDQLVRAVERALHARRLERERDRLIARLRRQVRESAVLARIGQLATSSLNLDDVLRRIVEAAVYLTHSEEGFLLLHDDETGELVLSAERNVGDREVAIRRVSVKDTILGEIVRSGKPQRTTERLNQFPLKLKTGYLVRASLHVPLQARQRVVGLLSVANVTKRAEFSEADESLLVALGDFAAIAIVNARLYEESHRRTQQALGYSHQLAAVQEAERRNREDLDRLRSNFLNAFGHELKTPLMVVLQSLELLRDPRFGPLNPQQTELLETFSHHCGYLQHLIDGLVAFARFNAKQGTLSPVATPLKQILDEVLDVALFKAQSKEIEIREIRPPSLPELLIDPARLSEALLHLVDNAIKYSPPHTIVTIDTRLTEDWVRIQISDHGPGIPESELPRIWESFSRMSDSMERGLQGLGLGLAMARAIVEAHRGQITAHSVVGQGSTFTIALPNRPQSPAGNTTRVALQTSLAGNSIPARSA